MLTMVNSMMDVSISNGVLDVLDVLGQQKKTSGHPAATSNLWGSTRLP